MAQHRVERVIRGVGRLLYGCGYLMLGAIPFAVALVLTLIGAVLVCLSGWAPLMFERYDPFTEIRIDHMLLVLDEPIIFGSYRLNDLFKLFDLKILTNMQVRWFIYSLHQFSTLLEIHKQRGATFVVEDGENSDLVKLSTYLSNVCETPEQIPEAIGFMRDWMEDHPLEPNPEHTEQE
jgi:hypothetical protein